MSFFFQNLSIYLCGVKKFKMLIIYHIKLFDVKKTARSCTLHCR